MARKIFYVQLYPSCSSFRDVKINCSSCPRVFFSFFFPLPCLFRSWTAEQYKARTTLANRRSDQVIIVRTHRCSIGRPKPSYDCRKPSRQGEVIAPTSAFRRTLSGKTTTPTLAAGELLNQRSDTSLTQGRSIFLRERHRNFFLPLNLNQTRSS